MVYADTTNLVFSTYPLYWKAFGGCSTTEDNILNSVHIERIRVVSIKPRAITLNLNVILQLELNKVRIARINGSINKAAGSTFTLNSPASARELA